MSDTVMTPKFRVSFPDVFRPGKADDSGKQKYGVTMLFEPGADLTALTAEAMRAGKEKWGADETKWPKGWKNPFKEQGDKSYDGYVAGGKYISALSAKVCLEQEDYYYTSPAFNGSSTARDQVGTLLTKCLTADDGGNVDAMIKTAFAEAVDECEYNG